MERMCDTDVYCGALKSPDDPNDFIFERIAAAPIGYYLDKFPEELDIRGRVTARDQGRRSTCAAFVGAEIKEIHNGDKHAECMSPEFIYYHRTNKPASGMYGRNVFQILQKIGCVPEDVYPYLEDETASRPSDDLYIMAARYRIANYARVTTVDGLKRALLEIGPCYLQLPLYSSRPYFWREVSGEIPTGHALIVVGYNNEGFRLVNSWGPTWNDNGSIIFPFSEWDAHWECWASVDKVASDSPRYLAVSRAARSRRRGSASKPLRMLDVRPARRIRSGELIRHSDDENESLLMPDTPRKNKELEERCSVM